jgi:isopenicillin-N epimerase
VFLSEYFDCSFKKMKEKFCAGSWFDAGRVKDYHAAKGGKMLTRRHFMRSAALATLAWGAPGRPRHDVFTDEPLPNPEDPEFWTMLRSQFPIPVDEAYCNTGTLGASPRRVVNRMIDHLYKHAVEIARCDWSDGGIDLLSGYFPYVDLRTKIGKLINADYKEIALTQNATMGMNFLSNGLDLPPGAEVLTTDKEHSGGRSGWQLLAKRRGTEWRQVPVSVPVQSPEQILDGFLSAIGPKTRVLSLPHITSGTGTILPVREICRAAAGKGIFTIVDGAQAIGHIPVDVKDIGCDAYYASPHKWLMAPAGTGILYIRNERMDEVWTTLASGQWDNHEDNGYRLTQRGTGNAVVLAGLDEALDFHFEVGPERIYRRIKRLGDQLRDGLRQIPQARILTSLHPEMSSGMTTFNVREMDGKKLQDTLWERGRLQPRSQGNRGVRYSTHIYNSPAEVKKALRIAADLAGAA